MLDMNTAAPKSKKDELIQKIEQALDGIRPYLVADGGNVKVLEITKDNVLRLEFVGNCGNCAMSHMTFKAGVEDAIKRSCPEIKAIEVINLPQPATTPQ
jgi:Fe-S cluster biogenesis protein NfuA